MILLRKNHSQYQNRERGRERKTEEEIYFKELSHTTVGADKSEICMAGWKFR